MGEESLDESLTIDKFSTRQDEDSEKPNDAKTKRTRAKGGTFCHICQKKLRSRYHLKIHLAVHTGEKSFICDICKKGYQQKWNLLTHMARVHSKVKPFKCNDCGKEFGYSSHFKRHVKTHFLEKIEAPETVKKRILNPYKCEFCEKSFETNYRLELHTRRHTGARPFVCDKCAKKFSTRRLIAIHMKKKHDLEFDFICEQCGESFADRSSILRHLQTGHKICDILGEQSSDKRQMSSIRIASKHKKELTPCEVCGKSITRGSMKKHLNIHFRSRVYSCRFCNKEFLESGQKLVHERKHTGEKPYLCDVCGRGHTQYGNLLTHRKRYHNLNEKTSKLWKRNNKVIDEFEVQVSESKQAVENDLTVLKTDLQPQETSETAKPSYTGDETIEEFLKIASNWINKKFEECKSSKVQSEDDEDEPDSEDDLPLSALHKWKSEENQSGSLNDVSDSEGEISPPEPLPTEVKLESLDEESVPDDHKKDSSAEEVKGRINNLIFEKILEDLETSTGREQIVGIREAIAAVKQGGKKGGDSLKRLIKLMKSIPDNVVMKTKEGKVFWHCWMCESKSASRHLLARHLLVHEPEENRPYRCDMCQKTFTQSNNYKEHVMSHKNENQYYCDKCGSGFRHKSHFNVHIKRHDPGAWAARPHKYDCAHCDKKFSTNFHRNEHQRTHTKEKPYLCKICGNQFAALSTLNRHQRTHMDARHQCDICYKFFREKYSLKRHYRTHATTVRIFCECGKSFSQNSSLKKHKKICESRTEPVEKPFNCVICSKRFFTRSDLKRHVATHDSSKRFKCSLCLMRLKTEETHKRHMERHQENLTRRDVHEDINKLAGPQETLENGEAYVCNDCDSVFYQLAAIRKHILSCHVK